MKNFLAILGCTAALIGTVGCAEKGPAEKAGEKLDQAVETSKDKVKEGAAKVGDAAEKAGDKIKEAAKEATK